MNIFWKIYKNKIKIPGKKYKECSSKNLTINLLINKTGERENIKKLKETTTKNKHSFKPIVVLNKNEMRPKIADKHIINPIIPHLLK